MYLCTHRSTQVASPTLSSGSLYMATHLRKHCSVILRAREKRKSTHPECCNAAPRLISPPGRVLHSSNRHRRGHRWRAQEKRSVEASAAAHLLNISVIASSSVCCAACMLAEKKTDRGTSCCVGRPRVCRGTTSTAVTVIARFFVSRATCTHFIFCAQPAARTGMPFRSIDERWAWWRSIGSPRNACAPMVLQSELACE